MSERKITKQEKALRDLTRANIVSTLSKLKSSPFYPTRRIQVGYINPASQRKGAVA